MDVQFRKRKTGKDKERRNRELYGNYSAKHVRIQEQCQENHLKNIHEARLTETAKETAKETANESAAESAKKLAKESATKSQQSKGKSSKNKKGRK